MLLRLKNKLTKLSKITYMRLIHLHQNLGYEPIPLDSCKSHTEARQSTRKWTEWPQYKPEEYSGMNIKGKMHVNEIKKETCLIIRGQFPNSWAKMRETVP